MFGSLKLDLTISTRVMIQKTKKAKATIEKRINTKLPGLVPPINNKFICI